MKRAIAAVACVSLATVFATAHLASQSASAPDAPSDRPAPQQPASAPPPAAAPPAAGPEQPATDTQTEPMQRPTFRTGVELVTVDVTVLDDQGRPVKDLRAPEFTVKIDGKLRRVVSAEYVEIDIAAAKKAAEFPVESHFTTNFGPPAGRSIVFVVDQGNIRAGGARPILATAAKYLDRMSPLDRVALVTIPPPGPVVDFTTDRLKLRNAMQQVVGNATKFDGTYNIGMTEAVNIIERHDQMKLRDVAMRECGFVGMTADQLERCERQVEIQATEMLMTQRERTSSSLMALRELLRELSIVEGAKSLIFISEGLQLEGAGTQLDDLVTLAGIARVSLNVLLLDVPRFDASQAYLSPTAHQDRALEETGLETLAGQTRGALFRVTGTGESIFERLAMEMSGYYLLGVEQEPGDRDGKRHRIDVEVRRRSLTMRSRRAFVLPETPENTRNAERALATALRSPFAIAELPIRATTYSYQDQNGKVRVVVAADVGQSGAPASEYTVGFVLVDRENRVVANLLEKKQLTPTDDRTDAPLSYVAVAAVDPGIYWLRFGAVDADGRRGTVLRPVHAWETSGLDFAVGDLMVGNTSERHDERILPAVEARVRDEHLAAYLELYSSNPASFEQTAVVIDVAEDEISTALVTAPAQLIPAADSPMVRAGYAVVPTAMLPPGRYVARAHIKRNGEPAGELTRPFFVLPRTRATMIEDPAPASLLTSSLVSSIPPFDASATLGADVLATMLDAVEQAAPALQKALAGARSGNYGVAARAAFDAGNQQVASFLRGLELFATGQMAQAIPHLNAAAGTRREFFPAAFYLGASFAASGRDRDAAGVWQLAMGSTPRPAVFYTMLADARLRQGQPAAVVDVLRAANQRWPGTTRLPSGWRWPTCSRASSPRRSPCSTRISRATRPTRKRSSPPSCRSTTPTRATRSRRPRWTRWPATLRRIEALRRRSSPSTSRPFGSSSASARLLSGALAWGSGFRRIGSRGDFCCSDPASAGLTRTDRESIRAHDANLRGDGHSGGPATLRDAARRFPPRAGAAMPPVVLPLSVS
jgi:VWFA-related protein